MSLQNETRKHYSILVIDDHNMVVNGIKLLVGAQFREFFHANNGGSGVELALQHQPQLVIVDHVLPDMPGDAVVREVKYRCPATRILGYSFNTNPETVLRMFEAGVHGYLVKNEDDGEFCKAMNYLLQGKDYFCREARNHIINRISVEGDQARRIVANTEFSHKEIEIIRLICRQHTAREISRQVFLSERTVEQYRSNITRRIGARNIAGIIKFALTNGLINLEDL